MFDPYQQKVVFQDHRLMNCQYTCNLSVLPWECSKFSVINFSRYNLCKKGSRVTYDDSVAHHLILFIESIVMVVVCRAKVRLASR